MAQPYLGKYIEFELDQNSVKTTYQCYITNYLITSGDATQTEVETMCTAGSFALAGTPGAWTLTLDYVQDWNTSSSLSWLLVNAAGKTNIPFRLLDRAGGTTGVEVKGTIASLPAATVGAQVNTLAAVTGATFPLAGPPIISPAAAAPAITGVTAGIPGSFGPAGSLALANLAALKASAVVGDTGSAKPSTAWTTGQYILLGDNSRAHWDNTATAWVVGPAA